MLTTVGEIKVEEGDNSSVEHSPVIYRMQRLLERVQKI